MVKKRKETKSNMKQYTRTNYLAVRQLAKLALLEHGYNLKAFNKIRLPYAFDEIVGEVIGADIDSEGLFYEHPYLNPLRLLTLIMLHQKGYRTEID